MAKLKKVTRYAIDALEPRFGSPRVFYDGHEVDLSLKLFRLCLRDGAVCAWCGLRGQWATKMRHGQSPRVFIHLHGQAWNGREVELTIDHKTSVRDGGSEAMTNLHILCADCNTRKAARGWEEFIAAETPRHPDRRIRVG